MEVPTPISIESLMPRPILEPSHKLRKKETMIMMIALTTPTPTSSHMRALVTRPRRPMVPLRSLEDEKLAPRAQLPGRPNKFVTRILYMNAHMRLLMGL
jgi:hypothetical protein